MGIYQYQCPYCNKGINTTNGTKTHIKKYHTGIKGFHCNRCRQEFDSVHQLKVHLAICTASAEPTWDTIRTGSAEPTGDTICTGSAEPTGDIRP